MDPNSRKFQKDYKKLQEKILQLKAIDKKILSTEIATSALRIQREMKRIAPFDTGNLRDLIIEQVKGKVAEIRSDADYSGYVEFGKGNPKTSGTQIPFFYNTVNKGFRELTASIEKRIKQLLK